MAKNSAVSKKTEIIDENIDIVNKEDKKEELVSGEVNNEEKKELSEVEALKKQIEEMKIAMQLLLNNQTQPVKNDKEDEVIIGCRVLQGIGWGDPNDTAGEIRLKYNEELPVTISDMKRFFRKYSTKKLFEDGLCYFSNENDYVLFNIKKHVDLSNDNLVRILKMNNIQSIISEFNVLTENKKNSSVINCVIYRICDMIKKNEINLDYYTRTALEKYFGIEFDRGIIILRALENL